jgi:uracil-DNA glycosylase family 4
MSEDREALRSLAARVRTNLALRARSGLAGVPAGRSRRGRLAGRDTPLAITPFAVTPFAMPIVDTAHVGSRPGTRSFEDDALAASLPTGAAGLLLAREELGDCQRCKLARGRTNIVFGVGNPEAHLVFVGEGPGADEDAQGEPFVGKAGQLLNKMIEAMGYRRQDVYICNVVKCRPPGNRNPEPDEIEACEPFLKKQLAALRPRVIVTLGKFAAQCLLRDDTPISRLRGKFRSYQGIQLMPTFHPAYLLRDPSKKKETWEDLKTVMAALREMGLEPPPPGPG